MCQIRSLVVMRISNLSGWVLALVSFLTSSWTRIDVVAINILGFVPDSSNEDYFSLSEGLNSVLSLAVAEVNANNGTYLTGELSITFVPTNGVEIATLHETCVALDQGRGVYGAVGPLSPSDASLLGSASSSYASLPIVTYGAPTANDDVAGDSQSYLFQVQPNGYSQMKALAQLIVEMKAARDTLRGTVWSEENIGVVAVGEYGEGARDILTAVLLEFSSTNSTETITIKASSNVAEDAVHSVESADIAEAVLSMNLDDISIIVVLAGGQNARIVRALLHEALDQGLVSEKVQWYFGDGISFDGLFDVNATYRDADLAYSMRGSLGVRPCSPITGTGKEQADALKDLWAGLNTTEYAGGGELLVDGRLEPMYSFAYDSVITLAKAIGAAQTAAGGADLLLPYSESCLIGESWPQGNLVEEALLELDFTGTTGQVRFENARRDDGTGATVNHRRFEDSTFCAVNLRRHETLGGAFVTMKTWSQESQEGFVDVSAFVGQVYPMEGQQYPLDRPRLQGTHLNILVQDGKEPMLFVSPGADGKYVYSGVNIDYLNAMAQDRGFTYTMHHIEANESSEVVFDKVAAGEYDMGLSTLIITAERLHDVSFSYPYYDFGEVFVIHSDHEPVLEIWRAFTPFGNDVWMAIVGTLLVVVFTLWLFEAPGNDDFSSSDHKGCDKQDHKANIFKTRMIDLIKDLSRSLYVSYALLVGQMSHKPETLEGYIVTIGWLFVCFILGATYTANLASFLTISSSLSNSVTLSKLQTGRVDHSEVAILAGSSLETTYHREVMFCDTNCTSPFMKCNTNTECLDMVNNKQVSVAFLNEPIARYLVSQDFCDLELLPDIITPAHYGIALPLDSPYINELEEVTLRLREEGLVVDAAEEIFSAGACVAQDEVEEDLTEIQIEDISGVLAIFFLFLVAGFFVHISHRCYSLYQYHDLKKSSGVTLVARKKELEGVIEGDPQLKYRQLSRSQRKKALFEAIMKMGTNTVVQGQTPMESNQLNFNRAAIDSMGAPLSSVNNDDGSSDAEHSVHMGMNKNEIEHGRPVVSLRS